MKPVIGSLILCGILSAQQPTSRPTFEVASIRLVDPNNAVMVGMSADPSFVSYRNLTVRDAIRGAYRVGDYQIVGPDWMSTLRFELDAKLPAGATTDNVSEMLQSLLEERFKLTWRRDPKEMQVYALLSGKDGPKLKTGQRMMPNQTLAMGTDGKPRSAVQFGGSRTTMTITAPSASVLTLVGVISRFTIYPVVDETGIQGLYDFTLTFAPETDAGFPAGFGNGSTEPAPTLSEAVKQFGLRIEPRKASVDMFVVTHIEKTPTAN